MDNPASGVGVLDKVARLLGALEDGPLSLMELSAATGLARPTAHRLGVALEVHGLICRDEEGRFGLGRRLIRLGRAASDGIPLARVSLPALVALRDETGESAQLFIRQDDERVCLLSLESPHGLRTIVPVGAALPLDKGSAGRVLLHGAGDAGWIESVAEREEGVASVSAPVIDPEGTVRAAVSVSGPILRVTGSPTARLGDAVVRAARAVEQAAYS